MKLWDCITKENRKRITERYEKRFGKEFIPPGSDESVNQVEPKIEDLEEIDKLMRQKHSDKIK